MENSQAQAKSLANEERPAEDVYQQKKLELNLAEHLRLEAQNGRHEVEENTKAERKKLENQAIAENARREAEVAAQQLKMAEEKQELLLAGRKLEAERKRLVEEVEHKKLETEFAEQKRKEEAESKKLEVEKLTKEEEERSKRELQALENRNKEEKVRQLRSDEEDKSKYKPSDGKHEKCCTYLLVNDTFLEATLCTI